MKLLLDSNAYSAMVRGRSEITDRVRQAEEVLLSLVVMGELLFGSDLLSSDPHFGAIEGLSRISFPVL